MSRPELPNTLLTRSAKANRPKNALVRKWFKVQKKGTLQLMTVTIEAADVENAFAKICTKVKVDPVGASFVYPLRTSEKGTHDDITVENGEDLNDSLMTFFLQCEEGSKLIINPPKVLVEKTRDYRPTEYGYNTIVGPSFVINRHFYEYLQENHIVVSKYLQKRDYLNLILGRVCQNFLSPSHFYCPIRGCKQELLPLGGFNKISTIVAHMRDHSRKGDSFGKRFLVRHQHLLKNERAAKNSTTPH